MEHGIHGRLFPRLAGALVLGAALFAAPGCSDPRDALGRTWYIDGVGNWGFGVDTVPAGLAAAGYRGHVDNFRWSVTLNPVLDQTLRIFARAGGLRLSGQIREQLERYPDVPVSLIGLSAGTGVALWAVENLDSRHRVGNVVLLASSLSSTYDVRPALRNMTGEIVVYYSRSDPVLLGPAKLLGTIDGEFNDSAGLVGLRGPGARDPRVRNVAWSSQYARLGWTGSHTDCTSEPFIRVEVSKHIVGKPTSSACMLSP
jgi:hypothetical protein